MVFGVQKLRFEIWYQKLDILISKIEFNSWLPNDHKIIENFSYMWFSMFLKSRESTTDRRCACADWVPKSTKNIQIKTLIMKMMNTKNKFHYEIFIKQLPFNTM